MSGYDKLLEQLRGSVRELGEGRAGAAARRSRWRRPRRGLLVVFAALVVGAGVATAAQIGVIAHHDDHPLSAREVASRAVAETRTLPACRPIAEGKAATTEPTGVSPAAGGLLTGAEDPAALATALKLNHGGPVVARTARRIVFADGSTVVLWVAVGDGAGSLADPAACGAARLAQLAKDEPDPGSRLRQKAEAVLRGYRDVIPGLQSLWVFRPRGNGGGGTAIPLDGRPLPTGVVSSDGHEYVGLAVPGAARVTTVGRRVDRVAEVKDGVFVVALPDHSGPVKLRQLAADGRVLAAQTLRG